MSRKVKLLALLLVFVLFGTSTEALAKSKRKLRRRPHVSVSQSRTYYREADLITESEAQEVVRRQLGTRLVRFFGKPKLSNKADDYPVNGSYRPVYSMVCSAQGSRYNVDVDAITGQVLKLAFAR